VMEEWRSGGRQDEGHQPTNTRSYATAEVELAPVCLLLCLCAWPMPCLELTSVGGPRDACPLVTWLWRLAFGQASIPPMSSKLLVSGVRVGR
jgi:hypothetical protein